MLRNLLFGSRATFWLRLITLLWKGWTFSFRNAAPDLNKLKVTLHETLKSCVWRLDCPKGTRPSTITGHSEPWRNMKAVSIRSLSVCQTVKTHKTFNFFPLKAFSLPSFFHYYLSFTNLPLPSCLKRLHHSVFLSLKTFRSSRANIASSR